MLADALVVIPARLSSTRFHRKLLAEAGGYSLLWRTWHGVFGWQGAVDTIIATDSAEIIEAATGFGAKTVFTLGPCRNGSVRTAAAYREWLKTPTAKQRSSPPRYVVDVQADEVFAGHAWLDALLPIHGMASIATLVTPLTTIQEEIDPGTVKAVLSSDGYALYFTRHPITTPWRHLGIYAFDTRILPTIEGLAETALARDEDLEQMDWLDQHLRIRAQPVVTGSFSINTPRDLERLKRCLEMSNNGH